jgi:hypothetical protein
MSGPTGITKGRSQKVPRIGLTPQRGPKVQHVAKRDVLERTVWLISIVAGGWFAMTFGGWLSWWFGGGQYAWLGPVLLFVAGYRQCRAWSCC